MDQLVKPIRTKTNTKLPPRTVNASKADAPVLPTLSVDLSADRSRQVLAALLAFSDGDFATRLPTEWLCGAIYLEGEDALLRSQFGHYLTFGRGLQFSALRT